MLIIPIQEWLGFQVELWINSYVVFIDVLGKLVCLEAAGEGAHQPSPRWARRGDSAPSLLVLVSRVVQQSPGLFWWCLNTHEGRNCPK